MKKQKVLLINPPFEKIYEKTSLKGVAPSTPPLSLACLGASLIEEGHLVKIFDFNLNNYKEFLKVLENFDPSFIGITFVTPLIKEVDKISKIIKEKNKKTTLIGGGAHCSSFPDSALKETKLDIVVFGEGDFALKEIVAKEKLDKIKGVAYWEKGVIKVNKPRDFIKNLDSLPFPAHDLYDFKKYKIPFAIARKNPVAWLETSRGCVFECIYCNKSCFGRNFRVKSPERVVNEFKHIKNLGFKEIHLTDDGFTTNIERAKKICKLLIKNNVDISWSTITGIRVDRVDLELLKLMKKAGCYRVYYGIESGDEQILKNIKKKITLKQVVNAVRWAKEAKLEVAGYFMIGLPGETKKTMKNTLNFAKFLDLDLTKISITIPLPATEMFDDLEKKGKIKTKNWQKFKFYSTPSEIYDHPNLSWKTIENYYRKFYTKVYLNPKFLLKRLKISFKNKKIFEDLKLFLSLYLR